MQSRSNLPPVMKPAVPPWSSDEHAAPVGAGGERPQDDDTPTPGEVLAEAGLLLAIHLAVAFAVALTLRLCGIA